MELIFTAAAFGFLTGLLVGCEVSWRRWRRNVDEMPMIEWRSEFFKVIPGWLYDELIAAGAPVIPGENYKAHTKTWLRAQSRQRAK